MNSVKVHSLTFMAVVILGVVGSKASLGQSMNAAGNPCAVAGSTADTAACFDKAYKAADRDLNSLYGRIQKVVEGEELSALKLAERLWVQYRDATCNAERELYSGGSAAPATHIACLEAETRARHASLMRSYGWRLKKFEK